MALLCQSEKVNEPVSEVWIYML